MHCSKKQITFKRLPIWRNLQVTRTPLKSGFHLNNILEGKIYMRKHTITRDTAETKIEVDFLVDGEGKGNLDTGVGFLDHMLTLFTSHGLFDLNVYCDGDTEVDDQHPTEDICIALEQAYNIDITDIKVIPLYTY